MNGKTQILFTQRLGFLMEFLKNLFKKLKDLKGSKILLGLQKKEELWGWEYLDGTLIYKVRGYRLKDYQLNSKLERFFHNLRLNRNEQAEILRKFMVNPSGS